MTRYTNFFAIITHNQDILVIQTNAGKVLADDLSKVLGHQTLNRLNAKMMQPIAVNHTEDSVTDDSAGFGDFNLGLHVNDDPKKVLANRGHLLADINAYLASNITAKSIEAIRGFDAQASMFMHIPQVNSIYWLNQIHSRKVIQIPEQDNSTNSCSLTPASADAMITAQPFTALAIMTADCVPIVLFDKTTQQIAAIHAGWKGLANGVIAETYAQLQTASALNNSRNVSKVKSKNKSEIENKAIINHADDSNVQTYQPQACQAWIGTCISQSCYEVSQTVVDTLVQACVEMGMDIDAINKQIVGRHSDPDKAWLDVAALAALQLKQLGIQVMQHAYACSYSDSKYYSYRRKTHLNQAHMGRMATLIMRLR